MLESGELRQLPAAEPLAIRAVEQFSRRVEKGEHAGEGRAFAEIVDAPSDELEPAQPFFTGGGFLIESMILDDRIDVVMELLDKLDRNGRSGFCHNDAPL